MADESERPSFPSPEAGRKDRSVYREPSLRTSEPSEPARPSRIVTRAEPPPASRPSTFLAPVEANKLTPEEIRAIASIGTTNRIAIAIWRRGRVIAIPTGIISLALQFVLGRAAPFFVTMVIFLSILWTARPLFGGDGWTFKDKDPS